MKEDALKGELLLIVDEKIEKWTRETLLNSPDYFFTAPASSTGKYHPECTTGEGGLIVHTKRVVYVAHRLCNGWGINTTADRDIVLSASILHDIAKTGKGHGSYGDYENHPINAEKYFAKIPEEIASVISVIKDCIRFHMGLWSPEEIKKPINEYSLSELLVYTADYMATTKDLITPKDKKEEKKNV